MADPIFRIAKQRIIKLSADLEVQLAKKDGGAVAIEMLRRLHDEAAKSLTAMVFLNFDDPGDLIKAKVMQNEVKRYDEWVGFMRDIINQGMAYDKEMGNEDRQELLDYLLSREDGEREAVELGLIENVPRDA